MFFQLFSTIKVKLVNEMMQRAYLCVILHVKHKKLPFVTILTWFLILGKIQDRRSRWRPLLVTSQASSSVTTNKIYLILLSRSKQEPIKAFHWRQNRFEILQHIKNSLEGFYPHPPYPLYHGWGMNLIVRPRVNPVKLICIICFSHLL